MGLTGSVQAKNGRLYGAINYNDSNGKRKVKWVKLNLDDKGNKREAKKRLNSAIADVEKELEKLSSKYTSNQNFYEYLLDWLKITQNTISKVTFDGYELMVKGRIKDSFDNKKMKLGNITPKQINEFYEKMLADGCLPNTVIHYHAALRKAFEYAVKHDMILSNPCDKADRPKKNQYNVGFYSQEELKTLLEVSRDDPMYVVIILAAYYGMRRSEVIGVKWSAIDFEKKNIHINHKVVEERNEDGSYTPHAHDKMKNKSSRRTMPLIPEVEAVLLEHKKKQKENKKLFGKSYSQEYLDYVCTNALGELMRPNYVTSHFGILLKKHNLKHIRFHDLRHTCASLLLENGVSMKQIQEWLGHSTFATTADIYAHLAYDSKIASAGVMSKVIGNGKTD